MAKVGILTLFHNNRNYGAILQAYALCKVINDMGFECQQIDCKYYNELTLKDYFCALANPSKVIDFIRRNKGKKQYLEQLKLRDMAFSRFVEDNIPHTKLVLTQDMKECVEKYDSIVVGSDQVWNPSFNYKVFMLPFHCSTKKISYAASIARSKLLPKDWQFFGDWLKDFKAISIRENGLALDIQEKCGKNVTTVLDPTLLLSMDQWDEIERGALVQEEYVFCYFLTNEKKRRDIAKQFAKNKNMILVNIPHADRFYSNDVDYGDVNYIEASPGDFVSLIKYANYVFTDSFHACVFSGIYQKQFFVFPRLEKEKMNTRIEEITVFWNAKDHYLIDIDNIDAGKLSKYSKIDYKGVNSNYLKKKHDSIDFLMKNIG